MLFLLLLLLIFSFNELQENILRLCGEWSPEYVSHSLNLCLGVLRDLDLALADSVAAMYAGKTRELGNDPSSPVDLCFTWQKDLLGCENGELTSSILSSLHALLNLSGPSLLTSTVLSFSFSACWHASSSRY